MFIREPAQLHECCLNLLVNFLCTATSAGMERFKFINCVSLILTNGNIKHFR